MVKLLKLIVVALCLWASGLAWFVYDVIHLPADHVCSTDGIVVLTGGKGRVEVGLQLLKQNTARRLLITGVHEDVKLRELLTNKTSGLLRRIDLGYIATNTVENALEARVWINKHHLKSISLVTADYHLRRAILEFKIHLKTVDICPQPVHLTDLRKINRDDILRLMREFNKFLASGLRFLLYQLYALKNL